MNRPQEDTIIRDTAAKIAELEFEYAKRLAPLEQHWNDTVTKILEMQMHYEQELKEVKQKCNEDLKQTLERLRETTEKNYEGEIEKTRILGQQKVSEAKIEELTAPLTRQHAKEMKNLDRKILEIENACKATRVLQTMIQEAEQQRRTAEETLAHPIVKLKKEHEAVVSSLHEHLNYTLKKIKRDY